MMRIWTLILIASIAVAGLAAYGVTFILRDAPDSQLRLDDTILNVDDRATIESVSQSKLKKSKPHKNAAGLADQYKDEIAMIVPHKAVYDIVMVERRSGSQVLNISGQMYFELKKTCDAWVSDHRFNMVYEYADTAPMRITSDFVTYEPLNGDSLDFTSRRRRDGVQYQELRGRAQMYGKNGGAVEFTMPEDLQFDLPSGTLFPMTHTLATLKAARNGEKFMHATMFDGSDEEGPVEVNVFVGKQINAMDQYRFGPAIDPVLVNTPAWRMHLAFFPVHSPDPQSDYEMDVIFHENGMISHMDVDYDEFSVSQNLVALEKLPAPDCDSGRGQK